MLSKTKILIFLALWKRPKITELCFEGLNRLRTHPDFDIQVLAVLSEEEMKPLCAKYHVNYVECENSPLGRKKNYGLSFAKNHTFDYLMEIGSDDLILNELLDSYKPFIESGVKFFGIRDAAYIDSEGGYCNRLQSNSTYGAGRMIHRSLLELVDFRLWKETLERGLDNNSVFSFMRRGIDYKQVKPMAFPGVIDVKSAENIWPFNHRVGVP